MNHVGQVGQGFCAALGFEADALVRHWCDHDALDSKIEWITTRDGAAVILSNTRP